MQAIVSDIHSNMEAFAAVLRDIKERGVRDVICLGDVIGYGPNPKECVDAASSFPLVLLGNHEEAVLHEVQARGFNRKASSAVRWTAAQFDMLSDAERKANALRWDFLGSLKLEYESNGVLLVHGSPVAPTREYIYPSDARNPVKLNRIYEKTQHVCFVGHTHVPGVWTEDMRYYSPEELGLQFRIDSRKAIFNVGSVGQPRDLDNRACYVLFDGEVVQWVRVPYDFEATAKKIYAIPELDNWLGDRLREGK